jgi:hypothetical protein
MHGDSNDVISANVRKLCECGHSEAHATALALRYAKKGKNLRKVVSKVVTRPSKDRVEVRK